MIRFVQGDLLSSGSQTLVNPVNCLGVMGKGLAKAFKDRWPEMFKLYRDACLRGEVRPGLPHLYRTPEKQILSVPTKDDYKAPSTYEIVEAGLRALRDRYREWDIQSLALPALGCGLGGLDWPRVREMIEANLTGVPIEIEVYEPRPESTKAR
jgi:O-acetyl-ADP-ribose deacetylase (regulator of RNase III)